MNFQNPEEALLAAYHLWAGLSHSPECSVEAKAEICASLFPDKQIYDSNPICDYVLRMRGSLDCRYCPVKEWAEASYMRCRKNGCAAVLYGEWEQQQSPRSKNNMRIRSKANSRRILAGKICELIKENYNNLPNRDPIPVRSPEIVARWDHVSSALENSKLHGTPLSNGAYR